MITMDASYKQMFPQLVSYSKNIQLPLYKRDGALCSIKSDDALESHSAGGPPTHARKKAASSWLDCGLARRYRPLMPTKLASGPASG